MGLHVTTCSNQRPVQVACGSYRPVTLLQALPASPLRERGPTREGGATYPHLTVLAMSRPSCYEFVTAI
jgi:hypothetical protein